ncbi:uncharacterized protein [Chlorocebus sabaeus]|uniref:uncharacterized protein n=1 Tax=Chlorocebus sabaeus TaxID=60711 RepID=UPI003BF9AC2E
MLSVPSRGPRLGGWDRRGAGRAPRFREGRRHSAQPRAQSGPGPLLPAARARWSRWARGHALSPPLPARSEDGSRRRVGGPPPSAPLPRSGRSPVHCSARSRTRRAEHPPRKECYCPYRSPLDTFHHGDMDAAGNHHSQQTITRTENQTPHVLTHRWELNNEITWTRKGEHHTPGPIMGRGQGGGIALGVIPDVNDEFMGADELMGAAHQHGTSIHM